MQNEVSTMQRNENIPSVLKGIMTVCSDGMIRYYADDSNILSMYEINALQQYCLEVYGISYDSLRDDKRLYVLCEMYKMYGDN